MVIRVFFDKQKTFAKMVHSNHRNIPNEENIFNIISFVSLFFFSQMLERFRSSKSKKRKRNETKGKKKYQLAEELYTICHFRFVVAALINSNHFSLLTKEVYTLFAQYG